MRPHLLSLALGSAIAALAGAAAAADTASQGPIPITGNVTTFCSIGGLGNVSSVFDLGVLTDPVTGRLLQNLGPVSKTLNGATCNAVSTITVAALPMTAQNNPSTAPDGFSRSVDYTASASGWTTTPATFVTSQAANPGAEQARNTPFTGSVTVTLSNFNTTGGQDLRLVADPLYSGAITVTLTASD